MASAEAREAKVAEQREREKYTIEAVASHSREKIQLCHEIILDHFGNVAAQVAFVLLQRGRLTLRELSHFLSSTIVHASTGLALDAEEGSYLDGRQGEAVGGASTSFAPLKSQRLIQQALLTLIQHNICWHVCIMPGGTIIEPGNEGSVGIRGTEYFQINVDEVLPRVRFGAYLAIAEEEFGPEAVEIVNELLLNGKMQAGEVVRRLDTGGNEHRAEKIRIWLRNLLLSAHVKPSVARLHTSPRDRRIAYEAESFNARKKMLTPKQRVEISVDAGKRLEQDEKEVWRTSSSVDSGQRRRGLKSASKKRAANGKGGKQAKPSKKAKTVNGRSTGLDLAVSSGEEDGKDSREELEIEPDVFLRVNFDRFDVHIRDDIIYRAVEHRYNRTTADVLQAMMRMNVRTSENVPSAKDEQSVMLHTTALRQHLPDGISLKRAFDRDSLRSMLGSEPAQSSLLSEIMAILLGAGDISRAGLRQRLVSPSATFKGTSIGAGGSRTPSQLHIEFGNAARILRAQLLRNVVEAQFGISGSRIMALLRDMGKLEEKHISKMTLMPMGETRDVCARLFASSLLSLQEVPKSSERIATRTIFFWYVDDRKCTAWLCDHLFKTLCRLSQRRRQELAKEADLINKSERTDVANDNSLMSDVEKRRLRRVRETVNIVSLGELRTWRDLFVVLQLPE